MAGGVARRCCATWTFCSRRLREASLKFEKPDVERPALSPLLQGPETRRSQAAKTVSDALESQRYRGLCDTRASRGESPARGIRGRSLPRRLAAGGEGRLASTQERSPGLEPGRSRLKNSMKPANEPRVLAYTAELIGPMLGRRAARDSTEFIRLTATESRMLSASIRMP